MDSGVDLYGILYIYDAALGDTSKGYRSGCHRVTGCFCIDFLLLWATFDTWYAFQEDYLEIKSACFCHKKIHYFAITSIEETQASYSSVALSNDRLDITYVNEAHEQEEILISPVKKMSL